jgi:hypothetical protein
LSFFKLKGKVSRDEYFFWKVLKKSKQYFLNERCLLHIPHVCSNALRVLYSLKMVMSAEVNCVPQCSIHVQYWCSVMPHTHVPVCPGAPCINEYLCATVLYECICVPKCSKHVSVCPNALHMYLSAPVLYTCICVAQCSIHVSVCPSALNMYLCVSVLYM